MAFPAAHRRSCTGKTIERVNKEIKRSPTSVGIFPRVGRRWLVGAGLIEITTSGDPDRYSRSKRWRVRETSTARPPRRPPLVR